MAYYDRGGINIKRDKSYYLGRLHREHPALAALAEAGSVSVYAACRQVGIIRQRVEPVRVSADIGTTATRNR